MATSSLQEIHAQPVDSNQEFCEDATPKPKVDIPTIETDEIGEILDKEYRIHSGNEDEPIEYFYIQVRKRNYNKAWEEKAREILYAEIMKLPAVAEQGWKKVKPGNNWPAMFFGRFPKRNPQESERNREERLNRNVREKLKENVETEFQIAYKKWCENLGEIYNEKDLPEIHVMITRCCLYTGPDYEYMEQGDD